MKKLNDTHIRNELIYKLKNQPIKPKAVMEELRVHNGNAIADVVALYNEAHCFEIKGDGDKIERILKQGYYYNLCFRKITLVTTNKHIKKATSISPAFWGIILAETNGENVSLRYVRKTNYNKYFDKNIALLTLWKSEMLNLASDSDSPKAKTLTRKSLAEKISAKAKKTDLSHHITSLLFNRHQQAKSFQ